MYKTCKVILLQCVSSCGFIQKLMFAWIVLGFCFCNEKILGILPNHRKVAYTHSLYKKLRIWASAESFLKLSDFEYSEFLTS